VSDEDQSVLFLEDHIENSFGHLMSEYIIKDLDWFEVSDGTARAIATLADPTATDMRSNIICLFPPFYPNNER